MREETTVNTGYSLAGVIVTVQDVLRGWYLILAAALVAAMLTFVVADAAYRPQYKTTTTFVVTAAGTTTTTYQNLSSTTALASTFTEVLNSSLLRRLVTEQAGMNARDCTVAAAAIPETNLLTVTVTGSDPRTVFQFARAIIENHEAVSRPVLGSTILEVLQSPVVPTAPTNPQNLRSLMLRAAILAGSAVAAALAASSLLSDRLRSKEEADRKLSCRVLGELCHERKRHSGRRKTSILITNPLTGFVYTEAVSKLASRVEKRRHKGEKVIMVTSLLENEGKSTVAVNLALSLARKGRRVLLIDADLRKPACRLILNMPRSELGLADVLAGNAELSACVRSAPGSELDVLTSRASIRTAIGLVSSSAMQKLLKQAALWYDLVIVDTPPMALAPDAECIAAQADACLLVVRQNAAEADALNDAAAALEKTPVHLLGCVLNNVYGSLGATPALGYGHYGYGYGYGRYGKYGRYGYGRYGYGAKAAAEADAAKTEEGRDA